MELLELWERGWACLLQTLKSLKLEDLGKPVLIRGEPHSVPLCSGVLVGPHLLRRRPDCPGRPNPRRGKVEYADDSQEWIREIQQGSVGSDRKIAFVDHVSQRRIIVEERAMNLSPVEAINRVNESVTVEMLVQRTKGCTGSRQVFLDSEANHRDPKNLGVVVTESGRAKFSEAGIDDPTAHFNGKTIRVRGVVIRKENRPYIEVNDPSQIEMVK